MKHSLKITPVLLIAETQREKLNEGIKNSAACDADLEQVLLVVVDSLPPT